jgi:hypothetical protein
MSCALPLRGRLPLLALALLTACSPWRRVGEHEGFTLYVHDGSPVPVEELGSTIAIAREAVEAVMGPFRSRIRVHAWVGELELERGNRGRIRAGEPASGQEVPGIGPARVRAFHTRAPGGSGPAGVFVGTADCGTAVHELVHARLAEEEDHLPLWFEEGYASLIGDGALFRGRWIVDGLWCWPWRELRARPPSDAELEHLLSITAQRDHSVRDNVLVHFVGWAIVFDLWRELGTADWRALLDHFGRSAEPLHEARRRMERSLAEELPLEWLARAAASGSAGARLAAVKGTWKLDSVEVALTLLEALKSESDPEVSVAIAVTLLGSAGAARLPDPLRQRLRAEALAALERSGEALSDERERKGARALSQAHREADAGVPARDGLAALSRLWEE